MNLDAFNLSILAPALLAGLLVLSTHVPLGMQVLARGIVFIDLAIAQIATLGVIAADRAGFELDGWVAQGAAVAAALLGAALLTWSEKRWPEIQEALIGVLFALAASGGTTPPPAAGAAAPEASWSAGRVRVHLMGWALL